MQIRWFTTEEESKMMDCKNDKYVEFMEEPLEWLEHEFKERVKEAKMNGLSKEVSKSLWNSLSEHWNVFRVCLCKVYPAKVSPMRNFLDVKGKSVEVRARRYTSRQWTFFNKYISILGDMGYLIPNWSASWLSAPHPVLKGSQAKFQKAFYVKLVISATMMGNWQIPNVEAKWADFNGRCYFASFDFCAGFWPCLSP